MSINCCSQERWGRNIELPHVKSKEILLPALNYISHCSDQSEDRQKLLGFNDEENTTDTSIYVHVIWPWATEQPAYFGQSQLVGLNTHYTLEHYSLIFHLLLYSFSFVFPISFRVSDIHCFNISSVYSPSYALFIPRVLPLQRTLSGSENAVVT